MIDQFLTA